MVSNGEFNLLTAVIPVLHPGNHIDGLLKLQDETSRLGVKIIIVIDDFTQRSRADEVAAKALESNNTGNTKIISGKFGNPGAARNAALGLVKSHWVTFWDADDTLWPEKYLQSAKKYPKVDVIVGEFERINVESTSRVTTRNLIDLALNPGIWRIVLKSELLKERKFPELSMGEDQIFLMNLNLESKSIVFVNEVFYQYHIDVPGQLTKSTTALKDLKLSADLAREIAEVSTGQVYKKIIALRLYLTLLKQTSIPLSKRLNYVLNYYRRSYLVAAFHIVKQKVANHG